MMRYAGQRLRHVHVAVCVFGWEEQADEIHRRMLERVTSGLGA
jgi:hypothetical protein